jgi:Terpene cyclase DEP1
MKPLLIAIFVLFDAYTLYAIYEVGYFGIFEAGMANPGSLQVFFDLVIACGLISWWILVDARARGRNPWPYLLITLVGGSLGPLLYLLLAGERQGVRAVAQTA